MTKEEKSITRHLFRNKIFKADGQAFEDLFTSIMQNEYKIKERHIEEKFIKSADCTDEYLDKIKDEIDILQNYFREKAKVFYPNAVAGLKIENNDGTNQFRFNINAKMESDASYGINNVKIFCYDLTVLFKGYNHNVDFLFHESRLFNGIEEMKKNKILKIVNNLFSNNEKQYIATVNQNQLNEIKSQMSDEDFENIITKNTILTLTDDSDAEKLLGIKVDIGEK